MSAQTADPFDLDVESPPRDRWGRPLLVPAHKEAECPECKQVIGFDAPRHAFTRMSSLSNMICDQSGLATWEKRKLARGLAIRRDLLAKIAALPEFHADQRDKKSLTAAEKREDKATGKMYDQYIDEALEAAGKSFKANMGTAFHGLTDPGTDLDLVPDEMSADVMSFYAKLEELDVEVMSTETFVVNDSLSCAGSFDHLWRVPTLGLVVVDKKTGSVDGKGLAFSVQLSGYANSEVYDLDTDERRPLESLTQGERINRRVGLIAHSPLGAGRTDLYMVDLVRGYGAAKLATQVRQFRSMNDLMREAKF